MKIDICLPVYNEEKIIQQNIERLFNFCQEQNWDFTWQIIILVNGATDHTLQIANNLAQNNAQIKVKNYQLASKGNALREYGKKTSADIFVYMDIDLATDLEQLPELISQIKDNNYDLALGSRLLPQSKTDRSGLRELSSRIYNLLSRLLLHHHISDLQCGFKAIKVPALQKIIPYLQNIKWFFDTELVMFAKYLNYRIVEIPIHWSENRYEQRNSKIKLSKDSFYFLINLFKLKQRINTLFKK